MCCASWPKFNQLAIKNKKSDISHMHLNLLNRISILNQHTQRCKEHSYFIAFIQRYSCYVDVDFLSNYNHIYMQCFKHIIITHSSYFDDLI